MREFSRRAALTMGAAALAAPAFAQVRPKTMDTLLPTMLRPGDLVGLITPAGAALDAADVQRARINLSRLGLRTLVGKRVLAKHGYLGGTDQERADDLNEMIGLPSVNGIACMRGGYGTPRILELIDYEAIKAARKAIFGFSDITALLNAITSKTGLITFHGPTPASSWGDFDVDWLARALMQPGPIGPLEPGPIPITPEAETLIPGRVTGRLVGGNLSLLTAVGGSPYEPDYRGAILFIEEIGEEPYRVDRMLTQLILSGSLKGLKGLAFGSLKMRSSQSSEIAEGDFSMRDVLLDRAKRIGVPCCTGFSFGHVADQVTIPIGAMATLDASEHSLYVDEPGVAER